MYHAFFNVISTSKRIDHHSLFKLPVLSNYKILKPICDGILWEPKQI